jgi:hypothetical protein
MQTIRVIDSGRTRTAVQVTGSDTQYEVSAGIAKTLVRTNPDCPA